MISLITGGAGFLGCHLAEYFFHPKVNIEEGIKIVKKNINYWKNALI